MKQTGLKIWGVMGLLLFCLNAPLPSSESGGKLSVFASDVPPVTLTEVRYEKLMKTYLNKIKIAFSETDDARALEVLNQFLPEFNQKSDGVIKEFTLLSKNLTPGETEQLYSRLGQRAHTAELIALLFDDRINTRLVANANLKLVMDQLYSKSLEMQKPEHEMIAVDK